MDRRIIQFGLCGLLMTSVAMGASLSLKPSATSRMQKKPSATAKSAGSAKSAKSAPSAEPIEWVTDLNEAHKIAGQTGKPMLIVVGGPWCQFCKKLDREVLGHPALASYINAKFVPVHLDASKDDRAAAILEVDSLPTTVILSPEANLLGSIKGYVGAKEYATVLKKAIDFQTYLEGDPVAAALSK